MTSEDFSRALILSSRLYPLLAIKWLQPFVTVLLARICAARTVRLVQRLESFNAAEDWNHK